LLFLAVPFPLAFSTNNLYAFLISPFHATYSVYLILLDIIILIIFREENKSRSSSLCSFLHFPVGPNIPLSTLFSITLSLCSPLMSEMKFHTHRKTQAKSQYCIF
jgi:hypothetical protein